ncbi:DNA repair protein RecO [Candidatus Parcubacteria bacterium]|nr:DNA repair protein RecO [Candidatus Parcubacteria bacterium]
MSYHLYHTEGFVLGGRNIGESNRYYYLFTRDLGLVTAFAQGVRELKSKLRYHLDDFSSASFSLVRGKDVWRVTNAERTPFMPSVLADEKKRAVVAALFQFLRRFLQGEEESQSLFNELRENLAFLESETLADDELGDFELLVVARTLARLGYFDKNAAVREFLDGPLSLPLLRALRKKRSAMLDEVNRSIKESHL